MSEEGKDLAKLQSEIQVRMDDFKSEATRLAIQWQRTLLGLQKKGVKIIRELVPQYAEHYWTINPTSNPNEFEVKVPVCIPMSIGWFDRVEGGCYDDKSRTLTRNGFKSFSDVTQLDEICTLNLALGRIEYQAPTHIFKYQYNGVLLHFLTHAIDLLVTPNHNMLVTSRRAKSRGWRLMQASELENTNKRFAVRRTAPVWRGWNGNRKHVPKIEEVRSEGGGTLKIIEKLPLKPYLRFLGLWLAEGSLSAPTNAWYTQYRVSFANQDDGVLDMYSELVRTLGFAPIRNKTAHAKAVAFSSKQLYFHLLKFGHAKDKFIPTLIKNLEREALQILLHSLMVGGGSFRNGRYHAYYTTSKQLAEDVAEIGLKCRYAVSIGKKIGSGFNKESLHYVVYFNQLATKASLPRPIRTPYNGTVYCVEVPNHILLVERNGKICWCGNSHNVFLLNQSTKWFTGPLPDFIAREVNLPTPPPITVQDGVIHFDKSTQEEVEKKFGQHLSLIEEDKATIKQGHHYDIIADIIESGRLPFVPRPVLQDDLRESDFTTIKDDLTGKTSKLEIFSGKYAFEGEAYKTFLKYGCALIVWSPGTGKTVVGTYAFSTVKGRKALLVPTLTLKEQWRQFFTDNCPRLLNEVEIYTYKGMSNQDWIKLSREEFALMVFDESHWLPAPTFSKIATLHIKYRMGLSASPKREDGKEKWIVALSGIPVGEDWRNLMQILGKKYHTVNVHVVKDYDAKFELLKELYNPNRRTLIFVELLAHGEKIAEHFSLPFISGTTKHRLNVIKNAKSFVASRVLELGVSVKDLEALIEYSFQKGSRREAIQHAGRLMHSELEGRVHDILFTVEELELYGKRLYGLYEKGFRYRLIPHLSGVTLTAPTTRLARTAGSIRTRPKKPTAKKDLSLVKELHQEGYFVAERMFGEVFKEIERRGGKISKPSLFMQLNGLVRGGKLFKTRYPDGYKFKQR